MANAEADLYALLRRRLTWVTLTVAAIAVAAGWLVHDLAGLWGALMAAATGVLFMLTTVIVTAWAARKPPQLLTAALLGSWLIKMALAFVIVLVLRGQDFYDKPVFLLSLAAVVLAGLVTEAVTLMGAREAYAISDDR